MIFLLIAGIVNLAVAFLPPFDYLSGLNLFCSGACFGIVATKMGK